jgi:hypothetical protein
MMLLLLSFMFFLLQNRRTGDGAEQLLARAGRVIGTGGRREVAGKGVRGLV